MSKLEQLLQEKCPNGVKTQMLKDVSVMQRGTSMTRKSLANGTIPVISGGVKPSCYCDTYNREGETITVAGSGNAGYVQYWNEPIFVNDAFSIKAVEGVSTKYLYYYLSNLQKDIYETKKGAGMFHVYISSIEDFMIPIPPIEVQTEIVYILDQFTAYEAALRKELDLRKKQYAYYREKFLTFEDGVEYKTIEEIANYEQPQKYLVKKARYNDKFDTPVLTAGQTFILGYTNETDGIYPASKSNPVIIFDDFTADFKWVDFPFMLADYHVHTEFSDDSDCIIQDLQRAGDSAFVRKRRLDFLHGSSGDAAKRI